MTNVFQTNVFQVSDVFQSTESAAVGGFLFKMPWYWGAALPTITTGVISTIEHSTHPVNCVLNMDEVRPPYRVFSSWAPDGMQGPNGPPPRTRFGPKGR